jgi:hypothetical protein
LRLPVWLIRILLRDSTATALSSDALPSAADLDDWQYRRYLDVWGYQAEWTIGAFVIAMTTQPTAVAPVIPRARLGPIFPNPFASSTSIAYSVATSGRVTLRVFDVKGRRVRTLVDGRVLGGRESVLRWDGKDDAGRGVASGVYFCALTSGPVTETKRVVLLR